MTSKWGKESLACKGTVEFETDLIFQASAEASADEKIVSFTQQTLWLQLHTCPTCHRRLQTQIGLIGHWWVHSEWWVDVVIATNGQPKIRRFVCLIVVVLHNSNSISVICGFDMMYEMRRRKPMPTLLPTQGIVNLPHHIGMLGEQLAFDDAVTYTQWGNGLQQS